MISTNLRLGMKQLQKFKKFIKAMQLENGWNNTWFLFMQLLLYKDFGEDINVEKNLNNWKYSRIK